MDRATVARFSYGIATLANGLIYLCGVVLAIRAFVDLPYIAGPAFVADNPSSALFVFGFVLFVAAKDGFRYNLEKYKGTSDNG
jgi:hypothetical protein